MDGTESAGPLDTLIALSASVLLTRGVDVDIAAIRRVVDHLVALAADRTGVDREEAAHLVVPEAVADLILRAAEDGDQAVAVRPVRKLDGAVVVPPWVSGRLVMAMAQVALWAGTNHDRRAQHHATRLSVELGDALLGSKNTDLMELHFDLLAEAADLAERAAARIEAGGWSPCSCGEQHDDEGDVLAVATVMRSDADLARRLLAKAEGF